jgi:hypothetical protein
MLLSNKTANIKENIQKYEQPVQDQKS